MEKSATEEEPLTKVTIKKEGPSEDIKEYAETAMNELLGWYGYDNPRDIKRTTRSCRSQSGSNSSGEESAKFSEGCGWCGKPVDEKTGLTSASAVFCSELCFSQSRRASFKKNKTCDWCRHVRHAVSYVDFQDGNSQLQFCSDKCLNQYKMHIFCRETRAHLELHPHLHSEDSSGATLITPDLWLRNCKSPEPKCLSPVSSPTTCAPNTSPIPLISVTPSSKLLVSSKRNRCRTPKKPKKRRQSCTLIAPPLPDVFTPDEEGPQDLRIRHTPTPEKKKDQNDNLSQIVNSKSSPPVQNVNTEENNPQEAVSDLPQQNSLSLKVLSSLLPPTTVFVPYPFILPIPIPIPIPIPLSGLKKDEKITEKKDNCSQTDIEATDSSQEVLEALTDNGEANGSITDNKRLLRKRRKVIETKNKVFVKGRKLISSVSN